MRNCEALRMFPDVHLVVHEWVSVALPCVIFDLGANVYDNCSHILQGPWCYNKIPLSCSLHQPPLRKSLDRASPKLGAAMRMAMVQMMLKTLNPTRHRRSMTAAANCHCSDTLSCRSCSFTRSTRNCTSIRRACSWLSTATDRIAPLWRAADVPAPTPASGPQGPEVTVKGSWSGDSGVSRGGLSNFEDWMW
ncbi:hypothetical protein EYF80_016859 [Liparis tanakae]|uniref:Uncharacterized protein n=1 Tax=Liparis tanakae TaxID=230148 RepID=A0A4Z2I524_9TELE|nr:hypothetical protein EYF80_016859 [Liparis tanakae]